MKKQFLNYSYWRHKILPSALQVLYRPWLISLGLHGLLLMLPMPDRFEPPVSQSPKPLKEVKITDLPAPKNTATSPKPSATVSKTAPRSKSTPQPDIDTSPQLPKPTPSATPTPEPTPLVTLNPEPIPSATPTPGVKVEGGALETFLGELTASNQTPGDKASEATPKSFAKPDLFFDQLSSSPGDEPKWKSGILAMKLINDTTPDQVRKQVQNSQISSGKGYNTYQLDDYGGGEVWKVQQKSKVWYINLVPTQGANGTVVVVWKFDPNHPGQVR